VPRPSNKWRRLNVLWQSIKPTRGSALACSPESRVLTLLHTRLSNKTTACSSFLGLTKILRILHSEENVLRFITVPWSLRFAESHQNLLLAIIGLTVAQKGRLSLQIGFLIF